MSPAATGFGLSSATATLTYDMPDTFVMKIDGDMVSLAAIRWRKPIPSSDGSGDDYPSNLSAAFANVETGTPSATSIPSASGGAGGCATVIRRF